MAPAHTWIWLLSFATEKVLTHSHLEASYCVPCWGTGSLPWSWHPQALPRNFTPCPSLPPNWARRPALGALRRRWPSWHSLACGCWEVPGPRFPPGVSASTPSDSIILRPCTNLCLCFPFLSHEHPGGTLAALGSSTFHNRGTSVANTVAGTSKLHAWLLNSVFVNLCFSGCS